MLNSFVKLFIPCLALAASALPSFAVSVSYNTTGSAFTCNGAGAGTAASPTCTILGGGTAVRFSTGGNQATLSYTAVNPNAVVGDVTTNAQFGVFSWSGNSSILLPTNPLLNLADFTLKINQALPTVGSGTTSADLKGSVRIAPSTSGMKLFFNGGFVTIGGVIYTPDDTRVLAFNLPTTLGGQIDASAVPEPGFYGLLSLGVAGLFAVARRRRSATV